MSQILLSSPSSLWSSFLLSLCHNSCYHCHYFHCHFVTILIIITIIIIVIIFTYIIVMAGIIRSPNWSATFKDEGKKCFYWLLVFILQMYLYYTWCKSDVFILQMVQLSYWSISESASVEGRWSNVIPKTHLKMVALKFLIQDKNIWKGTEISDPGWKCLKRTLHS